jgi:hypothetical protein
MKKIPFAEQCDQEKGGSFPFELSGGGVPNAARHQKAKSFPFAHSRRSSMFWPVFTSRLQASRIALANIFFLSSTMAIVARPLFRLPDIHWHILPINRLLVFKNGLRFHIFSIGGLLG